MRQDTFWAASIAVLCVPLTANAYVAPGPQARNVQRRYRIPIRRQNSILPFSNVTPVSSIGLPAAPAASPQPQVVPSTPAQSIKVELPVSVAAPSVPLPSIPVSVQGVPSAPAVVISQQAAPASQAPPASQVQQQAAPSSVQPASQPASAAAAAGQNLNAVLSSVAAQVIVPSSALVVVAPSIAPQPSTVAPVEVISSIAIPSIPVSVAVPSVVPSQIIPAAVVSIAAASVEPLIGSPSLLPSAGIPVSAAVPIVSIAEPSAPLSQVVGGLNSIVNNLPLASSAAPAILIPSSTINDPSIVPAAIGLLPTNVNNVVPAVQSLVPEVLSVLPSNINNVVPAVQSLVQEVLSALPSNVNNVVPAGQSLLPEVQSVLPSNVNNIVPAVQSLVPEVLSALPSNVNNVVPAVQSLVPEVLSVLPSNVNNIIPAVQSLVPEVVSVLPVLPSNVNNIIPAVQSLVPEVLSVLPVLPSNVNNILPAVQSLVPEVLSILPVLPSNVNNIVPAVQSLIPEVLSALPSNINNIVPAIQSLVPEVLSILPSGILNVIPSALPSDIGNTLPSAVVNVIPSILPSGVVNVIPSQVVDLLPSNIVNIIPSLPSDIVNVIPSLLPSNIANIIPSVLPSNIIDLLPSLLPSIPLGAGQPAPSIDLGSGLASLIPNIPSNLPSNAVILPPLPTGSAFLPPISAGGPIPSVVLPVASDLAPLPSGQGSVFVPLPSQVIISNVGSQVVPSNLPIVTAPNKSAPVVPSGQAVAPIGSDANSGLQAPTAIVVAPSDAPRASVIPNLPKVIQPPSGKPVRQANTQLVQFGFLAPLNYPFVSANEDAINQIFQFLPMAVSNGIGNSDIQMQSIQPYDTTKVYNYMTTLAMLYVPADSVPQLAASLRNANSDLFNNPDSRVKTLMTFVNPNIPLIAGQALAVAGSSGASATYTPGSQSGADPFGPQSQSNGPVNTSSVAIATPLAVGAVVYGCAMLFVARRYKQRRQRHRRTSSVSGEPAWMTEARAYNDPIRDSHSSGGLSNSHSVRTQQISAPLNSANSLGW